MHVRNLSRLTNLPHYTISQISCENPSENKITNNNKMIIIIIIMRESILTTLNMSCSIYVTCYLTSIVIGGPEWELGLDYQEQGNSDIRIKADFILENNP